MKINKIISIAFVLFASSLSSETAPIFENVGIYGTNVKAIAGNPSDPSEIWVIPNISNGLFYSDDGGNKWTLLPFFKDKKVSAIAIDSSDPKIIYASNNNKLYKTIDSGLNWQLIKNSTYKISTITISKGNSKAIYIGTGDEYINNSADTFLYRSADGGKSWKRIDEFGKEDNEYTENTSATTIAVSFDTTNPDVDLIFVGTGSKPLGKSGNLWIGRVSSKESVWEKSAYFKDKSVWINYTAFDEKVVLHSNVYVAGNGGLWGTKDGGKNWNTLYNKSEVNSLTIANFYAYIGTDNKVYKQYLPADAYTFDEFFVGDLLDSGTFGGVVTSIYNADSDTFYIGSTNGVIKTTDNGAKWRTVYEGMEGVEINKGIKKSDIYYVATVSGLYSGDKEAKAWELIKEGVNIKSFDILSDMIIIAKNDISQIEISSDSGNKWQPFDFENPATSVLIDGDSNDAYAGFGSFDNVSGAIYKKGSQATEFEKLGDFSSPVIDMTFNADGKIVIALGCMNDGECGKGGIYILDTDNKLNTGTLTTYPITDIATYFANKNKILVSANDKGVGKLFLSEDGGVGFEEISNENISAEENPITTVAISEDDKIIYVGFSNNKIYKSIDDGKSFDYLDSTTYQIKCLLADSSLFAGTIGGLYKYSSVIAESDTSSSSIPGNISGVQHEESDEKDGGGCALGYDSANVSSYFSLLIIFAFLYSSRKWLKKS